MRDDDILGVIVLVVYIGVPVVLTPVAIVSMRRWKRAQRPRIDAARRAAAERARGAVYGARWQGAGGDGTGLAPAGARQAALGGRR